MQVTYRVHGTDTKGLLRTIYHQAVERPHCHRTGGRNVHRPHALRSGLLFSRSPHRQLVGALVVHGGGERVGGHRRERMPTGQDCLDDGQVEVVRSAGERGPQLGLEACAVLGGVFGERCAVWSFQLALRSRGLGSTLTSYHLEYEAEAAKILGIPHDLTQVGLLPVAYTTVSDCKPAPRDPVEQIAYLDGWGRPLV